ncbi:hypothetical protein [Micromonospora inositola]|uniref:Uncharacterized protein n=1 Tax=Micromonospora inositola TaxID=47865 RepID=A0A1C5I0K1_9ACTN|nr:hypothetical protein [Micromonospora inositola]SCG51778.1 hypothetical protein GA0070613_2088 [Micromonospora inositola]
MCAGPSVLFGSSFPVRDPIRDASWDRTLARRPEGAPKCADVTPVPPNLIDQNWLWVEFGGELLDAAMADVYKLEPVAGTGPPWIYVWAPGADL